MHFAVALDSAARSGKLDTRLAQRCAQGLRDVRPEASASPFDAAATRSFSLTQTLADGWRRWRDEGDAVLRNFGGRAAMCATQLCAVVESLAMMHDTVERRRLATAKHAGEATASGSEDEIEVAGAAFQTGQLPSPRWLKVMDETLSRQPMNRLTTPCVTVLAAAGRAMSSEAPEAALQKETSRDQGPVACVQASLGGQGHGRRLAIEAAENLTVEWQAWPVPISKPSGSRILALAAEPAALYLIDMRGAVFVLTWQSASQWRPLRLQHVSKGYVTLDGSDPALSATAIDCGESVSTLVTVEGDLASWNSDGGLETCPDGAVAPTHVLTALGTPDVGRWSPLRIALSGGESSLNLPRHWTCFACEIDNETFRRHCGGCGRKRPKDQPQFPIAATRDCDSSTPRSIAVSHPQLLDTAHLFKCDPLARLHTYKGSVLAVTTSGNIFSWGAVPPWEDLCLHMYRRGAVLRIRDEKPAGESGNTAPPSAKEGREYLILTHGPLGVVFRPGAALQNSVSTVAALIAHLEGYEILRTDAGLEDLPLRREQKGITLRGGLLLERAVDKPKVGRDCWKKRESWGAF
jgi:hypothetical protein